MRQSEIKRKYDTELGRDVKKHIYGEGRLDVITKSIGSKVLGKTTKEIAKKAATKATTKAVEKTGEFVRNKAGVKIIHLLSKKTI